MSTGPIAVISSMLSGVLAAENQKVLHQRRVTASVASVGARARNNRSWSSTPVRMESSSHSRSSGVVPQG